MGNTSVIEINGKQYDAVTGKQVSAQTTASTRSKASVQKGVGAIDGFAARRPAKKTRTTAAHAKKTTQKSQTLMRKGLSKPAPTKKTSNQTVASIKKSSLGTSARRQQTASQTQKSPHVSKFDHHKARTSVIKKTAAIAPKPAPQHAQSAPKKAVNHHASASRKASAKMIESALQNATSHTQKAPEHTKHVGSKRHSKLRRKLGVSRRVASLGTGALAVVLLAGFFAIQNVPNLSMRVASTRAGFNANMPGYSPSGFSFRGPINYNAGQVTVSFASNSDSRQYSVVQRSSNWTSDALLANFIENEGKQYQTFLDKGRTLYLYDGSNATWVDDGIWYQIEGDSDLTTDQLVRIASSL